MEGHTDKVFGVAMAGDGSTVVSCSWDMSVRVWDVETGQAVGKALQAPSQPGSTGSVGSFRSGVSRDPGGFVTLGSLNSNSDEQLFSYSTKDRMKDFLINQDKKHQKEKAQRKGFAVEPVEAAASSSILPEFGSYTSGQVLADVVKGKTWIDAVNAGIQTADCMQSGTLKGHDKEVLGVSISDNGLRCASCSVDGTVRMWDLTTGTQVAKCEGHVDWVWAVSMTADGKLVASCGKDHSARIWSFEGELKRIIKHKGEVLSVALTSDHKRLVTGQGKSVFIWMVHNGTKDLELKKHVDLVRGVSANETGSRVASCSKDTTVIIWDTEQATALFVLKGHTGVVRSVHMIGGGALSCSSDKTARLWNLATGACEATLVGHTDDVRDICMNANNSMAVSCSFDQTIRVWDLRAAREVASLTGHTDKVFGVAVSGEGSVAVSCSWDMSIRIWDIDIGQDLGDLNPPSVLNSFLNSVSSAPNSAARVQARDTRKIQAHETEILGVAMTADGSEALTCSVDGTVRLWDLDTGEQLVKLEGHSAWALGVAMTMDGAKAASCGRDHTVLVWDMVLRKVWRKLPHSSEVVCVALFDDGATAVAGEGNDVVVWNVVMSKRSATLSGHALPVRCVAVYSGRIVSGSQDATLRVWANSEGVWYCKHVLQGHEQPVRGVAVQNDVILSSSQDQTLRAWSLQSGELFRTMQGHSGDVRSVGLSKDGRRAVSGAFDMTVRIWDVISGQEVSQLTGHTDKIFGVAICADGSRAVSCSCDSSLRVWDLCDDAEEADHLVLHPPSVAGSMHKDPAPDSIMSSQSIVGAVKAALNRSSGYDEIQSDSSSDSSGRSFPEGPVSGGGVGNLLEGQARRKQRIRVDIMEEDGIEILEKEEAGSNVRTLGEAIQRFLGSKQGQVDLDDDEKEWERAVLAEERRRREIDPENAHEMSRLTGGEDGYDEDEEDAKLREKKDRARHRSSVALALGFVCFFPWCAGLILDGGMKSKDRMTRNINRAAVFLMVCGIIAAACIVGIRFQVPDNAFCMEAAQCDRTCAEVCPSCERCVEHSHWWCHAPLDTDTRGFCRATDKSEDHFLERPQLSAGAINIPKVVCSPSCGCNGCLSEGGNWCRYPLEKTPRTRARVVGANHTGALALSPRKYTSKPAEDDVLRRLIAWAGAGVGVSPIAGRADSGKRRAGQELLLQLSLKKGGQEPLLRRDAAQDPQDSRPAGDGKHAPLRDPAAAAAAAGRRELWSFDGDDGFCDLKYFDKRDDARFSSLNPDLCDCRRQGAGVAVNVSCASSCCCDQDGCHPTKCTT